MNQIDELSETVTAARTEQDAAEPPPPPQGRVRIPSSSRRRWALGVGGSVLALGGLLGGPAIADEIAYRMENGMGMTIVGALDVQYQGKTYTWAQIEDLQKDGQANVTVMDPTSSKNQGLAHAFDTSEQADAWACLNIPGRSTRPVCTDPVSP